VNFKPLLEKLELGKIIGNVVPLQGGTAHTTFKVETSSGNYAIKKINIHHPNFAVKKNFQEVYERSELIAGLMFKMQVPAVCSLSFDGEHVVQLAGDYFIIYPYIEGYLLGEENMTANHARSMGAVFALMHNADIQLLGQAHYHYSNDDYWEKLIRITGNDSLRKLLPSIIDWNRAYAATIPALNHELVMTHGDMHNRNVLWDAENKPHIVDWDDAAPMNPMVEVIGYALECYRITFQKKVNLLFFETLITSYFQNIKHSWQTTPKQAFSGCVGRILHRGDVIIRRMMGEVFSNDSEIAKGQILLEKLILPRMHFIQQNESNFIYLVEKTMKEAMRR